MNVRRRSVAAVLAALTALAGCSGPDGPGSATNTTTTTAAPDASGEFTLLSYNVAGLPAEISRVRPDLHLPLIGERLEPYDVVLTQEDFDWWSGIAGTLDFVNYHDRLREPTTHEWSSPKHPGPEAVGLDLSDRPHPLVGDGLGVLSRLELSNVRRVPWTGCFGGLDTSDGGAADCASMKGFLVAELTLPNGEVALLYNLHAEAGGTGRDQELQAENFRQLADHIARFSEGRAVIVAGDTNLHTDGEHPDASGDADRMIWERFLAETGLADACDATSCDEPGAIDKVAVRGSATLRLEIVSHAFVRDRFLDDSGEDLSDHPPLEVRIRWTGIGTQGPS